jgi:nucleoside 2-deoxyribosyltransferase
MTQIYLAGPLFSIAERNFNAHLAKLIQEKRPEINVLLPQENALLYVNCVNKNEMVFLDCIESIDSSDIFVALLEGSDADSGTCVELGYAFSKGKAILGIRTDSRISEQQGLNIMLPFSCRELYYNIQATIDDLVEVIIKFTDRYGS